MPRFIVNTPQGTQEDLQLGGGGSYFDPSRILWCWDRDGDPPVKVDLGYMERVEKVEPLLDANGKQIYDIIEEGQHKTEVQKLPAKQLVVYLVNTKRERIGRSKRPPKRLPPGA